MKKNTRLLFSTLLFVSISSTTLFSCDDSKKEAPATEVPAVEAPVVEAPAVQAPTDSNNVKPTDSMEDGDVKFPEATKKPVTPPKTN